LPRKGVRYERDKREGWREYKEWGWRNGTLFNFRDFLNKWEL
jgi:hypothetical protein